MWLAQVSTVILIIYYCEGTSSTNTQQNNKNLYKFGYTVRDESTRDFKTHQEIHDGEQVRGVYSLNEPNGDLRVVTYTADGTNGFKAAVEVHPFGTPGLSNIFSGIENKFVDQQLKHHTSTEQTIKHNKNNLQTDTITPLFSNTDQTPQINMSHNEENIKGEDINTIKKESINNKSELSQENSFNGDKESNEQIMILDQDYLPKNEYLEEDHGLPIFRQIPLSNSQEIHYEESHIIPVKIQPDTLNSDVESYIEMSTFNPVESEDNPNENTKIPDLIEERNNYSTILSDEKTNIQESTNITKIDIIHRDINKEVIKSNNLPQEGTMYLHKMDLINSLNQETTMKTDVTLSTVKPNITVSSDEKMKTKIETMENMLILTKPLLETLLNNIQAFETGKINTKNYQNLTTEVKPSEINTNRIIKEKNANTIEHDLLINKSNETNKIETLEQIKLDKIPIMLGALLIPTSVMKLTCFPNTSEEESTKTPPTNSLIQSNKFPLQTEQSPVESVITTVAPVYPIQQMHLKPTMSQQQNVEANQHLKAHSSDSSINSKPQGTLDYSTLIDGVQSNIPQKFMSSLPVLQATQTMLKLDEGQKSVVIDSTTHHPIHRLPQTGQFTHHFLPPPWASHPFRSTQTSNHKQMPIFVLPMSHNYNFVPTFNPRLHDNLNQ